MIEGAAVQSDQRRWLTSFANLASGEAGASLLRLLATVWIARKLGPDHFGLLSVGVAVGAYLSLVGQAGLDIVATRDVASNPDDTLPYLSRLTALRLMTSGAVYAAAAAVVLVAPIDATTRTVLLALGLVTLTQAFDVRWVFVARHETRWVAAASLCGAIAFLAGSFVFARHPNDLYAMVFVTVVADAVIQAVLVVASRARYGRWWPARPSGLGSVRAMLARGIPVAVTRGARTMIITLDVVFVRLYRPEAESGQYALAGRLVAVGVTYIGLYYHTYLPGVSAARGDPERLAELVRGARARMWRLGPLVLAALLAGCAVGVPLVFGHAYDATVGLTEAMLPALLLLGFTGIWSGVLLAFDRQGTLAWAAVVATAVNVAANVVLLPSIGAVGASIATVLAEAVQLVLTWLAARAVLREAGART